MKQACCTILSRVEAIPKGLNPPFDLGILTHLEGFGL